jgi:ornithine carbamoyltransferase
MTNPARHFINLPDISADTLKGILEHARALKADKFNPPQILEGLSLAMMFDKRSTRTRMSFELAMKQLGGHTVVMNKQESQIGGAESIESTAKVMSRYVDAIMARMSDHAALSELAKFATIPVINGMTDISHPCQIMASIMTIEEKLGSVEGKKLVWFGDTNNVSNTYVQAAPIFGYDFVLAVPEDLHHKAPKSATITADPQDAAKNADVLITDTWVSMGQEGKDIKKFWPYQVNAALMAQDKDKLENIRIDITDGFAVEKALKKFKRLCDAYGIVKEYRSRDKRLPHPLNKDVLSNAALKY